MTEELILGKEINPEKFYSANLELDLTAETTNLNFLSDCRQMHTGIIRCSKTVTKRRGAVVSDPVS
jgi:hypothetical protein